jgi:hypothetical protein
MKANASSTVADVVFRSTAQTFGLEYGKMSLLQAIEPSKYVF